MNPDKTRVTDYLKAKHKAMYTPARLSGGIWFRLVNGKWITDKVFTKDNPVKLRPFQKSLENPDGRKRGLL